MEKLELFVESWEFFREAAISGMLAGTILGALGCYIVLGRMVFMSAALSQVSSAGVAAGIWVPALLGIHLEGTSVPTLTSLVLSLAVFAAMARPMQTSRTPDAVLAAIYLGGASATVLISSKILHEIQDVQQLLTGNAVLVEHADYVHLLVCTPLILGLFLYAHRALEAAMFWPETARVARVPVRAIRVILPCVLVLVIAYTTRVMGALPVFALSCLPAIAARPAPTLRRMFLIAMAVGALCGFGGYVIAFVGDFPVGPSQTAAALLCAGLSILMQCIVKGVKRHV